MSGRRIRPPRPSDVQEGGGADSPLPAPLSLDTDALLRSVARSFYLTLRVLPPALREPIGLAYLLARAADTVADSHLMSLSQRRDALAAFAGALVGSAHESGGFEWPGFVAEAELEGAAAERLLLQQTGSLFQRLATQDRADAAAIRAVVGTLVQGMDWDLRTFVPAAAPVALEAAEDLDRYTYLVAGCVGEFWTDMLNAHEPAVKHWDVETQRRWGMEYGKALQLTNVLRDLPRDLRMGRCYLPRTQLESAGLNPQDLLETRSTPAARAVLHHWIGVALNHYVSAARYVLAIPRRCIRLRLAALWPALIGLQTLVLVAESERWLDPEVTLKVRRKWIYAMMASSLAVVLSNAATGTWLRWLARRVAAVIKGPVRPRR